VSEPKQEQKNRVLRWLEGATDARILTIPRLLGLLYGSIDDKLPLREAWRASLRRKVPSAGSTLSEEPPISFA
jgi:hypothetical protein